jgi:tetratricopeptide (TPR) repeat protein
MNKLTVNQLIEIAKLHTRNGEIAEAHNLLSEFLHERIKDYDQVAADEGYIEGISAEKYNQEHSLVIDELKNLYNASQLYEVIARSEHYIEIYSRSHFIWNILGAAYAQVDMLDEAVMAFKKVISLSPDCPGAYNNMGNVLNAQAKFEEALKAFQKSLEFNPDNANVYYNIGTALHEQNKFSDAICAYRKALEIEPLYAKAYNNLGRSLVCKGEFEDAICAYKKAIEVMPDYNTAHENLSFALLNNGLVKEGLDEFEWRWQLPDNARSQRHFTQPLWDGAVSLDGKRVLIWSEQGIGDTIIWSSFLPYVADKAAHCILECPEKLMPLMSRSFPNIEVRSENRTADLVRSDFDFHLPMGSLYRQFYSTISSHENKEAFLIPCPDRVEFWKEKLRSLGDGPYVGIGWKSSVTSPERANNYASILEWSPLLKLPNVKFVNLQYSDFVEDLNIVERELGIQVHNFDEIDLFDDLDDVAALCKALDTVVSTTSAVPRIAAGVGTHTKFACWKQSPWNNVLCQLRGPKVEQFDRNTWEPWENIFEAIAENMSCKS